MELLIPIDSKLKKPLYEQIYSYIRTEIRAGNLKERDRLPSTRILADHLNVSRSTTQMAYEQLLAEGYIEAQSNRGYFVSKMEELVEVKTHHKKEMFFGEVLEEHPWHVDFSPRGIALDSFPYAIWRKISKQTLAEENRQFFQAGNPQGEPGLREAIRGYLHSARGVNCTAEQIIVGAGSEYLLMLLSRILCNVRGVAMENPTYKQAYRVFTSLGYSVVPVEMDEFGMNPKILESVTADLAYVMPSHQYPTGAVMSVGRRQALLRWANEEPGRYLIEDDYDSEFRYKGKPIPALQGMDQTGKVIYLGTFSKSIAPAIRVSYLVIPVDLLNRYRKQAGFYASTVSRIDQNILYQFLAEGHFERHLNRMRAIYKAKHDTFLAALKSLESEFEIRGDFAGTHLLLTHKGQVTEQELMDKAALAGVKIYGISNYYIQPCSRSVPATLVVGYAALNEEEILLGVKLLGGVLTEVSMD